MQEELLARIRELTERLNGIRVDESGTPQQRADFERTLADVAAAVEKEIVPYANDARSRDEAAFLLRQLALTSLNLGCPAHDARRWLERAKVLAVSKEVQEQLQPVFAKIQDEEEFGDIYEMCRQGKLGKAERILRARLKQSTDKEHRKRIEDFLNDPRRLCSPIKAAPGLQTINGFGTMLYGKRSPAQDGTYAATLWLVFVFLPVIPVVSYIVRDAPGGGWIFYAKTPLTNFLVWWRRVVFAAPVLLILFAVYMESDYRRETEYLDHAEEAMQSCDYDRSLWNLVQIRDTQSSGRRDRMNEIAREAIKGALDRCRSSTNAGQFLGSTGSKAAGVKDWLAPDVIERAKECAFALAQQKDGCAAARDIIKWATSVSGNERERCAIAIQACGLCDDATILASTVRWHLDAKQPLPIDIVRRLRGHIDKSRYKDWDSDALTYIEAADAKESEPILLARVEKAWKGLSSEKGLFAIASKMPEPLRNLLQADEEKNLEKRSELIEKMAKPDGLPEPQSSWHAVGAARRLARIFGELNERDPIRFPISRARQWAISAAELAPEDEELLALAMQYLVEEGEYERAVKLGEKHESYSRIVTWLGVSYSRLGRTPDAARILRPYVQGRLSDYVSLYLRWNKAAEVKKNSLYGLLRTGNAPQDIMQRLDSVPENQVQIEAYKWVHKQMSLDPEISAMERKLRPLGDVHFAALELAMVELTLARELPAGEARQERLKESERLFLEIRKVSEEDETQDLQLGQVYFWLGKEKEGHEIYDRLEKSADGMILYQMGEIYRELGKMEEARRVLELAYGKLPADKRESAAIRRALARKDNDDEYEWLKKCNQSDPFVRASLDQLQGSKLLEEGKFADSIQPFTAASKYFESRAESPAMLNNAGNAKQYLAMASGDLGHLNDSVRFLRQANDLSKDNGIILGNFVYALERVGYTAIAGKALRADLLHELPDDDWVEYVQPSLTRTAVIEMVKSQVELRRAAELADRLTILAGDDDNAYNIRTRYFLLTGDAAALRKLRESIESAPPSRQESIRVSKEKQAGKESDSSHRTVERRYKMWTGSLQETKKSGHAPTIAHALVQTASATLAAEEVGIAGATLDSAIGYCEEAVNTFPAPPTWRSMAAFLIIRAARTYAEKDAGFLRLIQETRDCNVPLLLALYADKDPKVAADLAASPDIKRAGELTAKECAALNRARNLYDWMCLKVTGSSGAEEFRKQMAAEGMVLDQKRIQLALYPQSSEQIGEAWLAARAFGDSALEKRIADHARERKVLTPLFGQ